MLSTFLAEAKSSALAFANLVYPRRCVGCQADMGFDSRSALCPFCRSKIIPLTGQLCRCGQQWTDNRSNCAQCKDQPHDFGFARTFAAFSGPVKEMIHHFKYRGKDYLADDLSDFLFACWKANELFWNADAVVAVPPHSARLRERGYDHTLLLARSLLNRFGGRPVCPGAKTPRLLNRGLVRLKQTQTQTSLTRENRNKNVSGAFAWVKKARLSGQKIILLDDVVTTGATLNECAKVLLAAGAREVGCIAIARD